MQLTRETLYDAGLLREYVYERGLASLLIYGGTMKSYLHLWRLARRVARMIGESTDDVLAQWREDFETGDKWL